MDTVGGPNGERMVLIKGISQKRTQDGMQELSELNWVYGIFNLFAIINDFKIGVLIGRVWKEYLNYVAIDQIGISVGMVLDM
jgi:hypothetical protein